MPISNAAEVTGLSKVPWESKRPKPLMNSVCATLVLGNNGYIPGGEWSDPSSGLNCLEHENLLGHKGKNEEACILNIKTKTVSLLRRLEDRQQAVAKLLVMSPLLQK